MSYLVHEIDHDEDGLEREQNRDDEAVHWNDQVLVLPPLHGVDDLHEVQREQQEGGELHRHGHPVEEII